MPAGSLGWLTPEEASPIGVPWNIAKNYSPRVQRMLGYVSPRHAPRKAPLNWLIDFKDTSLHLAAVNATANAGDAGNGGKR